MKGRASERLGDRRSHHPGYAISQQKRKRTEEPFGLAKTIGVSRGPCYAALRASDSSSRDGRLRPDPATHIDAHQTGDHESPQSANSILPGAIEAYFSGLLGHARAC